jgi:hypothetical protein
MLLALLVLGALFLDLGFGPIEALLGVAAQSDHRVAGRQGERREDRAGAKKFHKKQSNDGFNQEKLNFLHGL